MCDGRTPRARSACATASAIAWTWRVFCPEHNTKKSVNAGVCRRSSTSASSAFLSSAACTAAETSAGSLPLLRDFALDAVRIVSSDFAMQLFCPVQAVFEDVCFDEQRNQTGDRLAALQTLADDRGRDVRRGC